MKKEESGQKVIDNEIKNQYIYWEIKRQWKRWIKDKAFKGNDENIIIVIVKYKLLLMLAQCAQHMREDYQDMYTFYKKFL